MEHLNQAVGKITDGFYLFLDALVYSSVGVNSWVVEHSLSSY